MLMAFTYHKKHILKKKEKKKNRKIDIPGKPDVALATHIFLLLGIIIFSFSRRYPLDLSPNWIFPQMGKRK